MKVFFILLLIPPCLDQHCTHFATSTTFFPQGQR